MVCVCSLFSRPCAIFACSTKFMQKANYSTETNDVIDELVHCLALKEAPRVMVCLQTYLSAKSFSSERAQAAIFSLIVDVYI